MSSDIQPGDVVVCVDAAPKLRADPTSLAHLRLLKVGRAYRVSDRNPTGVGLEGIRYPFAPERGLLGYRLERFRKIDAPKTELSERIRKCRPIRQTEHA